MTLTDWHPSEDDLTMALSEDESAEVRDLVAAHLRTCEDCRRQHKTIASVLVLIAATPAPDAGDDFEARMWARIRPALSQPSGSRVWRPRQIVPIVAWAAAIGGVVVGGYLSASRLPSRPASATPTVATRATDAAGSGTRERVLLAAVDAHLAQTEMLFVELLNAPTTSPETMAFARATAGDLVSSGRLYRETARQEGDVPVALVLDDLETVLVEVARSSESAGASDLAQLRGRIEGDDLLFKVRAVTHDIRAR